MHPNVNFQLFESRRSLALYLTTSLLFLFLNCSVFVRGKKLRETRLLSVICGPRLGFISIH